MSLLSAVLQEANKATSDELNKRRDELLPKIRDLTERVQMLSWALQQNLLDTYVNFTVTKSLEQLNFKNRKGNIDTEFKSCTEEMDSLREKFRIDDEFATHWQKLCSFYDTFKQLCVAVEGKRVLERANHEFNRFNYSDAILAIQQLKKDLKTLKLGENLQKVLVNLNSQAENQLALYSAHLTTEWEDIFSWSEKKGLQFLVYSLSVQQSDPLLLQKVLKTLYGTGRMNAELGLFSHFFVEKLLHNVIQHNCDIYTEDPNGAIVFNIKIDLNDTKKPSYQTIFNNLTAVFEFLQSTLGAHFVSDCSFIEVFAESIREKFFNIIIEDCIRNNLPSCNSSYEQYKSVVIELDSFNKFLVELKFVQSELSPLNKYIDDTECVLYNKKCDKLLSDVRELLKESLSCGTIVVGNQLNSLDNSTDSAEAYAWDLSRPLFLPRCVISQNVKQIMALILEHLEESVKLPEKYQNQLVSYIKDITVMYQTVVPKKFKVNLECCPADIALFFNNCFYLAHSLVGAPWSLTFPPGLSDRLSLMMLDAVQDFRVLGLEKVSLFLQKQKNVIIDSVEAKEPSAVWSQESYEQFECAVNDMLTGLRELSSSWLRVLPDKLYNTALAILAQVLCQAILDRVLGCSGQVPEHLVFTLAVKVEEIATQISALFEDCTQLESRIPSWCKLTKLPLLLTAQLLQLGELWRARQLAAFPCDLVRHVLKMRFPDDKYRLRVLKEIQ